MASALQTGSGIGATGLGIALPLLGVNPAVAGVVAAGAGLVSLLGKIGVGRKTANAMTQGQGPQATIDNQLQIIANDPNTNNLEKAQATQMAWSEFLQNTNQFAQNKNLPGGGEDAALVAWQAINKTPGLTNTVSSLLAPLGINAFDQSFKSISPLIGAAKPAKGSSLSAMDFLPAAAGAGAAVATSALTGGLGGGGGNPSGTPGDTVQNLDGSIGTYAGDINSLPSAGTTATPALDDQGQPIFNDQGQPLDTNGNPIGSTGGDQNLFQTPAGDWTSAPGGSSGSPASQSLLNQILGKNPLGTLLQTAGLVTNGILQSSAAKNAAGLQAGAANNAASLQAKTAGDVLDFAKQIYGNEQAANAPYLAASQNALGQIQNLIAPGGALSQPFVAPPGAPPSTFTLPTAQQAEQTPGFQFQLEEALKALGPTTKGVISGNTINAAEGLASGLASTNYNNLVGQELSAFNTNQGAYQNLFGNALTTNQVNRQNALGPLMTLAGFGPGAIAANTQAGNQVLNTTGNVATTTAADIGNLGQQAAAAQASGNLAGTGATTNTITGILNNLTNNNALQQVLQMLAQNPNNPALMQQLRQPS